MLTTTLLTNAPIRNYLLGLGGSAMCVNAIVRVLIIKYTQSPAMQVLNSGLF